MFLKIPALIHNLLIHGLTNKEQINFLIIEGTSATTAHTINSNYEQTVKFKKKYNSFKILVGAEEFNSVTQSCLTLSNTVDCTTLGLPVRHQLPELTQTHVH